MFVYFVWLCFFVFEFLCLYFLCGVVFRVMVYKRPCAYVNFCDYVTVPRNELLRFIFHTCTAQVELGAGMFTFLEHTHMSLTSMFDVTEQVELG